jgi:hypothetical protein
MMQYVQELVGEAVGDGSAEIRQQLCLLEQNL